MRPGQFLIRRPEIPHSRVTEQAIPCEMLHLHGEFGLDPAGIPVLQPTESRSVLSQFIKLRLKEIASLFVEGDKGWTGVDQLSSFQLGEERPLGPVLRSRSIPSSVNSLSAKHFVLSQVLLLPLR